MSTALLTRSPTATSTIAFPRCPCCREVCAAATTTAAVVANAAAVAVEEQHAAAVGQGEDAVDVLAEERDGVGAVGAEGTDRGVRRAVAG